MELVSTIQHDLWGTLSNKDVTFYNQQRKPMWCGHITITWSNNGDITKPTYVSAINVQTWNKDGSPRKGSATVKGKTQIFPGYYYSYGLTPEGVTPQPEVTEQVLTQAEVDAKLKEYVTERIAKLAYLKNQNGLLLTPSNVRDWHLEEAFVTIFRELTE
jgi:hypothetical protein